MNTKLNRIWNLTEHVSLLVVTALCTETEPTVTVITVLFI